MAVVFSRGRGTVAAISSGRQAVAFRVNIAEKPDGFTKAIITQAAITQNDNFQFLHTLADTVYVYVFGTRMGELVVSGIAFAEVCGGGGDGPTEIVNWYKNNRISQRQKLVGVTFGGYTFNGFLTGMNAQVTDAENILTQWSYRFAILPNN